MLAVLFPGQGSQTPDDREVVVTHAPELLELATKRLGDDPFGRINESTAWAQVAIHLTSAAHWRRLGGGRAGAAATEPLAEPISEAPGAFAGHSLGEIGALCAAGALGEEDALGLVIARGAAMAKARAGTMLAVRGDAEELAPLAALHDWVVANDNAPGQVVLSGAVDALEALEHALREHGWRAIRLPVTGAFHSPLMGDAASEFAEALANVEFAPPQVPVWCNATAAPFTDPRRQLAEAITGPVSWRQVLLGLREAGIERFLDTGPGTVLDGLVRRTLPDAERLAGRVAA